MRHARVYAMVSVMWGLMLVGGGIAVNVLGPLHSPEASGEAGVSAAKAAVAVGLVIAWVWVLSRVKALIFARREP